MFYRSILKAAVLGKEVDVLNMLTSQGSYRQIYYQRSREIL